MEETNRYVKALNIVLDHFLKTGKINATFKPPSRKWNNSLCYINKVGRHITEEKCNAHKGDKITVDFRYQGNTESYSIGRVRY